MDEANTTSNKISSENQVIDQVTDQISVPESESEPEKESRRHCPECGLELPFSVRVCPNDSTDLFLTDSELFADKYELVEEIGQGAIGTIYKARHIALDTLVAIKVLNQVTEDRVTFLRFQREAKTASKISHPNVINVFDFGIWKDCQPYMVMDYLEGDTLDKILNARGRLPLDEVVDLIIPVARALAHAHSSGILHRDLKPSNIMILDQAEPGARVKLLDFGLAKLLFRDDGISLSATGAILGSPAYMSPEQASAGAVDARTDIYSLGCIIYQLLTGDPPLMGTSAAETFMKRLNQDAQPVSTVVSRYIPPRLDLLVSRMVEREKGRRLKSAAWVHKELLEIKQDIQALDPQKLRPVLVKSDSVRSKVVDQEKTVAEVKLGSVEPGHASVIKSSSQSLPEQGSVQSGQNSPNSQKTAPVVIDFTRVPGSINGEELLELFKKQSLPIRIFVVLAAVLVLTLIVRILVQ